MSNTVRWFTAIFLVALGVLSALFSLAFLGFFSWDCYKTTSDIAKAILYVAAAVSIVCGIVPAIMLIRQIAGKYIVIALALSFIFILGCNGVYVFYTLNIC